MTPKDITEAIEKAIKDSYEQGFIEGATKQAIIELQGRDRFLKKLREEQDAINP